MSLTPQQLQFELMRLASFNNFDGDQVADDLQRRILPCGKARSWAGST
jgi:hypothetical protein